MTSLLMTIAFNNGGARIPHSRWREVTPLECLRIRRDKSAVIIANVRQQAGGSALCCYLII